MDDQGLPYIGYLTGEVYHKSKYNPSEKYGYSPIITSWIGENTILNMDLQVNTSYREQRPPKGILAFNTKNYPSLIASMEAEDKIREQQPMHIPRIAVESDSKSGGCQWIPITPTYEELQMLDHKKDYINRVAAMYGVMPIFMGDVSASGGLNNEGTQIPVTLHSVLFDQQFHHNGTFPWLMRQLKKTDFTYHFPSPIEEDKVALQQRRMNNINQIERILNMDAEVEITDEEELEFKIKGELQKPERSMGFGGRRPWGGGFGGQGGELSPEEPYEPEIEQLSKDRGIDEQQEFLSDLYDSYDNIFTRLSQDVKGSMSEEEQKDLARSIVRDIRSQMEHGITKNYADLILRGFGDAGVNPVEAKIDIGAIEAIAQEAPIWNAFDGIEDSLHNKFEEIIIDSFAVPEEFSISKMVDRMKRAADIETWRLRRIARTETNAVVNKGREMGYEQRDPEGNFRFKLTGRFGPGSRTCDAHEWINDQIQKEGGSVSLNRMRELHDEASALFYPNLDPRGFNIHPNQRKTVMRVVR